MIIFQVADRVDQFLEDADLPNPIRNDLADLVDWNSIIVAGVRIALVMVIAFLTYRLVRIFTGRLQREVEETDPIVKRNREQRAKTTASLLNSVALAVIGLLAFLMVLGTWIDIGPLLATAGIAGLAISFGAQSLVKDIISGVFILLEGQFGVGDVVRVGETAGMVERITLRTTVLRDVHGIVHVIPNGEILVLSNLTKGWSKAVLEIGVAYKEDVDHVIALLGEIGAELYADPEWRPLILEEPIVPGVEAFADSAVMIRVSITTLPLKQWDIAREFRRRVKNRFDRDGIEIPFPHRSVYWGVDQDPLPGGRELASLVGEVGGQRGDGRDGRDGNGRDGNGSEGNGSDGNGSDGNGSEGSERPGPSKSEPSDRPAAGERSER